MKVSMQQLFFDQSAVKIVEYPAGGVIFAQGDGAETVLYLLAGGGKISVLVESEHETVAAMLGAG